MNYYIVTYDLDNPGQNYDSLIKRIKNYSWAKLTESAWYIKSSHSAAEIRDDLLESIDKNDKLFVATINESAWFGLSKEVSDWIKNN